MRAAVADEPGFTVDDRETRRSGLSYSVDTLGELRAEFPQRSMCLLLGMDAFLGLPNWHRWREILELAHVVVAHRPGWKAPTQGPLGEVMVDRGTGSVRDLHEAPAGKVFVHAGDPAGNLLHGAAADASRGAATRVIWCRTASAGCWPRRDGMLSANESSPALMTTSSVPVPRPRGPREDRRGRPRRHEGRQREGASTCAGVTDVADCMVLASGSSDRHVRSIADRVVERAKEGGFRPMGIEGERDAEWVLVDLNDVIVHVMLPRVREFYGLEELWDAPPVPAKKPRRPASPVRRSKALRRQKPAGKKRPVSRRVRLCASRPQVEVGCCTTGRNAAQGSYATARVDRMRVTLVAVGQRMPAWVTEGFTEYTKRLRPRLPLELDGDSRREARQWRPRRVPWPMRASACWPPRGRRTMWWRWMSAASRAPAWSCRAGWASGSASGNDLVFLIGGADGFAPEVLARANERWSLSPLTLPHALVRVVFAEQLYRAVTLLDGHPYHRE